MYSTDNPADSWNVRDKYMFDTIINVHNYYQYPKTIVWAHNSHLGDARATVASEIKQLNVGQLLRQYFEENLFSIGMFTFMGEVIASDDWGKPIVQKTLKQAHANSNEYLLHKLNIPNFYLFPKKLPQQLYSWLNRKRLQRHIGVVYVDDDEINNHYSGTKLMEEFDAIFFFDKTTALQWKSQY